MRERDAPGEVLRNADCLGARAVDFRPGRVQTQAGEGLQSPWLVAGIHRYAGAGGAQSSDGCAFIELFVRVQIPFCIP